MPQLLQRIDDRDGYAPVPPFRESDVAQLVNLIANRDRLSYYRHRYLMEGVMRGEIQLNEVITTSSFAGLFGYTLERAMIARYRAAPTDWQAYCARGTMPNFNVGEAHKVMGNDGLLPQVAEKGEYLVNPVSSGHYNRRVYKWGRQFDISWEAMVNDAMNAFGDVPARMADSVTYTRAYNVTDLIASAAGPDALTFGAALADTADGQLITNLGALPLSILNLEVTLGLMATQTDVNGRPLGIRGMHLVVPPTLEVRALQILNSSQMTYAATAAAAVPLATANSVAQMGIQLHVNPMLPVIDTSANRWMTWYLFADLSEGKAIQMDFLRGEEDPEICMKASDKVTTAGALISPFAGDFATDNIFYRVRDVHGGTRLDRRFCYAQVSAV